MAGEGVMQIFFLFEHLTATLEMTDHFNEMRRLGTDISFSCMNKFQSLKRFIQSFPDMPNCYQTLSYGEEIKYFRANTLTTA